MSKKVNLQGKTALITGASSGLGADFARELANYGCGLVLAARRNERLNELKLEITSRKPVPVEVIPVDLTGPETPRQLYDRLEASSLPVDILINNAGYATYGPFVETPWERTQDMLNLDLIVATQLMHLFLPRMVQRRYGYVLNIASIGAYQPSPTYAAYSAAKTYIFYLSQAVQYELRHTGVHCTVISPGVTRTEFLSVAGQTPTLYQRVLGMDSAAVARIGIQAMLKGRASVVPGVFNSLFAIMMRFLPYQFQAFLADLAMRE
jgi:short-subunit dehydrogenase